MTEHGRYKIARNDWARLAKKEASIQRVTSIDVGTVTFSVATMDRRSKELLYIQQFDLASLFGFKNGKATRGQLQWIKGMKQVFDDHPELFSGDLIVVERQMKTTGVGRMCSTLLDITLTHFQALGREIQIGDPKGVKAFMAAEDQRIAAKGTLFSRATTKPKTTTPKATKKPKQGNKARYDANKGRSSAWLKDVLTPAQYKQVTKTATKRDKDDDLAEALRQALWVESKLVPPPRIKRKRAPTKKGKRSSSPKAGDTTGQEDATDERKKARKPSKKKPRVIVVSD